MAWPMKNRFKVFFSLGFILLYSSLAISMHTQKIYLGNTSITVEVTETPEETAKGLMGRESPLGDKHGMLFDFTSPTSEYKPLRFWMKNTKIPLSIAFFNKNCKLMEIVKMDVPSLLIKTPKTYVSSKPARFALEMDQGWFQRKNIRPGVYLKLTKSTLPKSAKDPSCLLKSSK